MYSVSYEQWTNIKIMEIIFNCIPTGTLGAVGQKRLKQVVIYKLLASLRSWQCQIFKLRFHVYQGFMNRGYGWPLWEVGRGAKICPPPFSWQNIKKKMIFFSMEANRLYFPVTQWYKGMICFGRKVWKLAPLSSLPGSLRKVMYM